MPTKFSDVRAGDWIMADDTLTCLPPGAMRQVYADDGVQKLLHVQCECFTRHYLVADEAGDLKGFQAVPEVSCEKCGRDLRKGEFCKDEPTCPLLKMFDDALAGAIGASEECKKSPRCIKSGGFVIYCGCSEREGKAMAEKARR